VLILETEVETRGCVVRVTRKYSRMDSAREKIGFDDDEEEQLLLLLSSWVVGQPMVPRDYVGVLIMNQKVDSFDDKRIFSGIKNIVE